MAYSACPRFDWITPPIIRNIKWMSGIPASLMLGHVLARNVSEGRGFRSDEGAVYRPVRCVNAGFFWDDPQIRIGHVVVIIGMVRGTTRTCSMSYAVNGPNFVPPLLIGT